MIKKLLLFFLLSFALIGNVFGASFSTLTDNFNDNSIDTAKWGTDTDGGSISEVNQEIEISSNGEFSSQSNSYDLTGEQVTLKIIDTGTISSTGYQFDFAVNINWSYINSLHWEIWKGKLYAIYIVAGDETDILVGNYSLTAHKYLQIRESSGTIYWDYSSDGITWTNGASVATPITITALSVYILFDCDNATTIKFDDFNILPSARRRIILIE
jgi:hypothetical protein